MKKENRSFTTINYRMKPGQEFIFKRIKQVIFIVTVVTLTPLLSCDFKNKSKHLNSNHSYSATYESPINSTISREKTPLILNTDQQTNVTTSSGAVITIPNDGLVNKEGEVVRGEIELAYREFLDQKDVFISGIPMKYDSAGVAQSFESGGMFELLAYQNDEPLFIAKNKKVFVDFPSKQVEAYYNTYYYSPEDSKWIYKDENEGGYNSEVIKEANDRMMNSEEYLAVQEFNNRIDLAIENHKKSKQIKPQAIDKERHSFNIVVDYKDFPELIVFEGLKFQISDNDKNFKPSYATVIWEDVNVTKGKESNEYITCFSSQSIQDQCFVTNVVYDKNNLADVQVKYEELLAKYHSKKDSLTQARKELTNRMSRKIELLNEQKIIALNRRAGTISTATANRVTRKFQISRFGIWNADYPRALPTEAIVKANFRNAESGNSLELGVVYLVDIERNLVISIPSDVVKNGINYNPDSKYMLWSVTNDQKNIAIFSASKFSKIKQTDKSYSFDMQLISTEEFASYSLENILSL